MVATCYCWLYNFKKSNFVHASFSKKQHYLNFVVEFLNFRFSWIFTIQIVRKISVYTSTDSFLYHALSTLASILKGVFQFWVSQNSSLSTYRSLLKFSMFNGTIFVSTIILLLLWLNSVMFRMKVTRWHTMASV